MVLIDTESWEQTPVCQLDGGGVEQLCWVSAVDCMMVQQRSLSLRGLQAGRGGRGGLVYTLHVPDSGGGDRDRDLAGEEEGEERVGVSVCPLHVLDLQLTLSFDCFFLLLQKPLPSTTRTSHPYPLT